MEQNHEQQGETFKPISDTLSSWGKEMMHSQRVNRETCAGIIGFGRSANDMEAVTVFVGLNTDLSDKEAFPDEVSGERIVYERSYLSEDE